MDLSDIYHANMVDASFSHLKPNAHFVPGDGNPDARVCFVGEAPGVVEDKRRLPFQGLSGRILNDYLDDICLERDEVFITNVLKYRPPGNRKPTPFEVQESLPYLGEELLAVKPEFVVLLGKTAAKVFYPGHNFHNLLGTVTILKQFTTLVTYHPAATSYDPSLKVVMGLHFKLLAEMLKGAPHDGTSHQSSTTGRA